MVRVSRLLNDELTWIVYAPNLLALLLDPFWLAHVSYFANAIKSTMCKICVQEGAGPKQGMAIKVSKSPSLYSIEASLAPKQPYASPEY